MKIDRLLAILTLLLQRGRVTAPELARRFEVSRRTISRDVDNLCKAGFPIVTIQGAGGGISIAEGFKLDKSVLTTGELQSILIGLRGLESVGSAPRAQNLRDKLTASPDVLALADSLVIDLASHYKESLSHKIGLLRAAIESSVTVTFRYYSNRGRAARHIEPYLIIFKWSDWYVLGYCLMRRDYRLFKLNRLWDIEKAGDAFVKREIPLDKLNLDAYFTDENPVTVLFDESAEYMLVEEFGPDCYTRFKDGRLLYEGGYSDRGYIMRWLLGFGGRAEVIGPPDLRAEMADLAMNIYQKHSDGRALNSTVCHE
ncbi:MAG: YafY family transcriptional regulator [Oscillospiraceae bacterium]|jgi:predicted DNA-binding transcriptional regulator YafY|nr:YafY family transcriptional regulator [Oscillospiraceae bacterium]